MLKTLMYQYFQHYYYCNSVAIFLFLSYNVYIKKETLLSATGISIQLGLAVRQYC